MKATIWKNAKAVAKKSDTIFYGLKALYEGLWESRAIDLARQEQDEATRWIILMTLARYAIDDNIIEEVKAMNQSLSNATWVIVRVLQDRGK